MAIQGGMDVYKALGAEKNLSYRSDTPSGTGHCSYTYNFTDMVVKNITKFLKTQPAETGGIVAGSGGTVTVRTGSTGQRHRFRTTPNCTKPTDTPFRGTCFNLILSDSFGNLTDSGSIR